MYTASSFRRIFAHILDEAITAILYLPIYIKFFTLFLNAELGVESEAPGLIGWAWIGSSILLVFVYEVILLRYLQGLPIQLLFGLKVVSDDQPQAKLLWGQCLLRVFTEKIKYFIGFSWAIYALTNIKRQTLADLIAETRVVQGFPRGEVTAYKTLGYLLMCVSLFIGLYNAIELVQALQFTSEGIWFNSFY